jgi:predicted DNA-binding protein YlxM (UPF0122 family)
MKALYTEEQVETIRRMYSEYYTFIEIAKEVGKTLKAIEIKVDKLKLPKRDTIIVRMVTFHGREILKLGPDRASIITALNTQKDDAKNAIITKRTKKQEAALSTLSQEAEKAPTIFDRNQAIKRARHKGATLRQIAEVIGLTKQAVYSILRGF